MRKHTPTPVITAALTLITLFFWAGFEVYRSFTVKVPPPVAQEIINPLDPTLDTKSLDEIASRPFLNETEIGNTISIAPSASPTPLASPSALVSPSPTPLASSTPSPVPTSTP